MPTGKFQWVLAVVFPFVFCCCNYQSGIIEEIHIGLHNNNQLKIELNILTSAATDIYAEYWPSTATDQKSATTVSKDATNHTLVLCNLFPQTDYAYQLVTKTNGKRETSKVYHFQSRNLPPWLNEQFKDTAAYAEQLPEVFRKGFMLLNKRETPGVLYITDYQGNMRWYHMIDGTGFKVAHFTADKSIISILGKNDEPTSYGSEILEINLSGDTLLHLKKGQADFKYTIHHEVLRKNKNEIVTLFVEDRIMDLSAAGGSKKDTVKGDGIQIMDSTGKELWKWSVFDVTDPLKDPAILKNKSDWMHANSLNYDKDNNFIISFYNTGQIWKVNAKTGQVIWKLGKGGSIAIAAESGFSMAHSAHINGQGSLMFFDNGIEKKQSEVFAFKINEAKKTAAADLHFKLPKEIYNERMGSAYMVNDTTILSCCSKRHITVLTNRQGVLLWTLDTAIPPYRVEFLKAEELSPFLKTY